MTCTLDLTCCSDCSERAHCRAFKLLAHTQKIAAQNNLHPADMTMALILATGLWMRTTLDLQNCDDAARWDALKHSDLHMRNIVFGCGEETVH